MEEVRETKWFFKVMIPGFQQTLNLPAKLSKKLKVDRSSVEAVVKSCRGTWKMEMCRNQELGLICFKDGWPDFVHAHDLSIGDFVVFKHSGNFHFNAVAFDSSACEKDYNLVALKKETKDAPRNTNKKKVGEKGCAEGISYESKNPYFIITMQLGHARKRPTLTIPAMFWRSHLMDGKKDMILIGPCGREWPMRLYLYIGNGKRRQSSCYIQGGWNRFYVGNKLKMGDVCAFELIENNSRNVVMAVHIFRAPSLQ